MKPQVLTIKTSAHLGFSTEEKPDLVSSCAIDSESTVFLEQPKEIKWKVLDFISLPITGQYGQGAGEGIGGRVASGVEVAAVVAVAVGVIVAVGTIIPSRVKTRNITSP